MTRFFPSRLRPSYRRVRGTPDPLTLFRRLYAGRPNGFLYESLAERGGRGRYSFLGGDPMAVFTSCDYWAEPPCLGF